MADAHSPAARFLADHDRCLLSRVEDAGLNASAPPQQRWMDGWLVRFSPGKAQRARCINAVAEGCVPAGQKLAECRELMRQAGLPMLFRITPFTRPAGLDAELAAQGFQFHDDTRVMVLPQLSAAGSRPVGVPDGLLFEELAATDYAEAVGAIRGSPAGERAAHAQRLRESPVPYRGFALREPGSQAVLACAQIAVEGSLVGLYDVATAAAAQRRGLASLLCERLLNETANTGATSAYLQVGAGNHAARRIYQRVGFADAYSYHYRLWPAAAAS